MGRKSKATENDLVELIIDKWEGGKNTIVYVTEDVNRILQEKGLKVSFSRESIRRVIKTHEEEIADAKKAIGILGGKIIDKKTFTLSDGGERTLIMIKKISQTSPKYPRVSAQISKKPL